MVCSAVVMLVVSVVLAINIVLAFCVSIKCVKDCRYTQSERCECCDVHLLYLDIFCPYSSALSVFFMIKLQVYSLKNNRNNRM